MFYSSTFFLPHHGDFCDILIGKKRLWPCAEQTSQQVCEMQLFTSLGVCFWSDWFLTLTGYIAEESRAVEKGWVKIADYCKRLLIFLPQKQMVPFTTIRTQELINSQSLSGIWGVSWFFSHWQPCKTREAERKNNLLNLWRRKGSFSLLKPIPLKLWGFRAESPRSTAQRWFSHSPRSFVS